MMKVVLTQHFQIYALGPSSPAPPPHLPHLTALLRPAAPKIDGADGFTFQAKLSLCSCLTRISHGPGKRLEGTQDASPHPGAGEREPQECVLPAWGPDPGHFLRVIFWKHQPPPAQATVYLLAGQRQASREGESGTTFAFQLFLSNDKTPGGCGLREEEGFILVQSLRHSQSIVAGQNCDGGGSFPAGRSTGSRVYCSRSRRCTVGRGHSHRFNVYSFNNLPNTSVLKKKKLKH